VTNFTGPDEEGGCGCFSVRERGCVNDEELANLKPKNFGADGGTIALPEDITGVRADVFTCPLPKGDFLLGFNSPSADDLEASLAVNDERDGISPIFTG
jgi:hypothetical protein